MQPDCCIQLFSTLVYHCASEWTATIIHIFYHHHCMEFRCHYHLQLLFSPPSPPVTFPAIQMCIKTSAVFFCTIIFSLIRTQDWVETSEYILTIDICPKEVWASGVSL